MVDRQVSYFLQLIWAEGTAKSLAAHTICGVQHFLNARRVFVRVLPPLPADVVLGIAGWLVGQGKSAAAALVLTGFHRFLRTGKLFSFRRAHVTFGASRLHGVLVLPWTKSGQWTGAPESVVFNDPLVARLLDLACARLADAERIFPACGS